mgnify:FL=1
MTQHTPGPWTESSTANARLIAAAPEMLAILRVLVARHPKDCACLGGCNFQIARALLAKIEGKP